MSLKSNFFSWFNNLSSRERLLLQLSIGFALFLLADQVIFTRVWDMYSSMEKRIVEDEGSYIRNLVNLKRKEVVESTYDKYKSYIRVAGRDEEENASFLSEVEQLARSEQVVLVDMKPREVKKQQFHKEYVADLDAEAEMEELIRFIYQLEQSPHLMKISKIKLTSKEQGSTFVKARMTVTKTVFLKGS